MTIKSVHKTIGKAGQCIIDADIGDARLVYVCEATEMHSDFYQACGLALGILSEEKGFLGGDMQQTVVIQKEGQLFDLVATRVSQPIQDDVYGVRREYNVYCRPQSEVDEALRKRLKEDYTAYFVPQDPYYVSPFFCPRSEVLYRTNEVLEAAYAGRCFPEGTDVEPNPNAQRMLRDAVQSLPVIIVEGYTLRIGEDGYLHLYDKAGVESKSNKSRSRDIPVDKYMPTAVLQIWDFLFAQQIVSVLNSAYGINSDPPLFFENAFGSVQERDLRAFIEYLRGMNRQVFFLQKPSDSSLLHSVCDKEIKVD